MKRKPRIAEPRGAVELKKVGLTTSRDVSGDHCAGGRAGHVQEMHLRAHSLSWSFGEKLLLPRILLPANLLCFGFPRVCSEEKPPQRAADKDLVLPSSVA